MGNEGGGPGEKRGRRSRIVIGQDVTEKKVGNGGLEAVAIEKGFRLEVQSPIWRQCKWQRKVVAAWRRQELTKSEEPKGNPRRRVPNMRWLVGGKLERMSGRAGCVLGWKD